MEIDEFIKIAGEQMIEEACCGDGGINCYRCIEIMEETAGDLA